MATYSSAKYGRGPSQRRGETRRTGQWKLAYADFLTALVALFLVLWVSSDASQSERSAIAAYFSGEAQLAATPLETAFNDALRSDPALAGLDPHIRTQSIPAGLRIELTERSGQPLFATGGAELNENGQGLIGAITPILVRYGTKISLEGHTDAFSSNEQHRSNWEISSQRANAARRALIAAGLPDNQIESVTGYAATRPLIADQPHAAVNRRISLIAHAPDTVTGL